jgi:tetraacyldisaccharide 4'-kinase
VVINSDRLTGAEKAVKEFRADVLIMDDGFQHRRLARDLDIITIDGTCPFGYGRILPGGLLREPLSSIKRAKAAVITRTDQVGETVVSRIEEKVLSINPDIIVARAVHSPVRIKGIGSYELSLEKLQSKNVFAFCGIGNPAAFLETVKKISPEFVGHRFFNDHHNYTKDDIVDIYEEAKYLKADMILTTHKDWPKTALLVPENDIPAAFLEVEMELVIGQEKLRRLIDKTLEGKINS